MVSQRTGCHPSVSCIEVRISALHHTAIYTVHIVQSLKIYIAAMFLSLLLFGAAARSVACGTILSSAQPCAVWVRSGNRGTVLSLFGAVCFVWGEGL